MGLLKSAKKAVKKVAKAVAEAAGVDTDKKVKLPDPVATMGPAGARGADTRGSIADRRRARRARGRDSTIITARSDIGSRTLLG